MRIRVLYENKSRGLVNSSELDDLAARGLIVAYCLPGSDEWVVVRNKHGKEKGSDFVSKEKN